MKKNLFTSLCIIFSILLGVTGKAQVPAGVTPAQGIPVLVTPTFAPLTGTGRYCQLTSGGSSGSHNVTNCNTMLPPNQNNVSATPQAYSHSIITSNSSDPLACMSMLINGSYNNFNPPIYLQKFPNIPDWNETVDGPLCVMKLGDEISACNGSDGGINSAVASYYFVPNDAENVLILYFAFVSQGPSHSLNQNPYFRIEVTDVNGNYITTNPMHSTFLVNPPQTEYTGIVTGTPHPCAHDIGSKRNVCRGSDNNTDPARVWCDWMPIAFDFREHLGQTIRLRLYVADCSPEYHYAYAYFTGRGMKGEMEIQACGEDHVSLSVPWGFQNYRWYINDVQNQDLDDLRSIELPRNTSQTEFRCEMQSYTGAPFVYSATVNYYDLIPNFSWEQICEHCQYEVQFNNLSEVHKINNGGDVLQDIQFVEWDFGDGNTSTEISPLHIYDGPGPYYISMTLYDNDHICTEVLLDTVLLNPECIEIHNATDSAATCEQSLPYVYAPTILDPEDYPSWNTPGNYTLTYEQASSNGCDSVVMIRFDVQNPTVTINQLGDYCDEFATTLISTAVADGPHYLWNNGETTSDLNVTSPGDYSLTVTDENGCIASAFIKVPACVPQIILPNTITPSDYNGLNDCVALKQANLINNIEFYLFDKMGRQVFYTVDKNFQWCGLVNGKIYPNAIYQYVLIATDYNGITTMQKGFITTL